MENKNVLTKILAIIGTVLVWLPVLAPVLLSVTAIITNHTFWFDYLAPAELFPAALAGGGFLLLAALRTRSHRGLIGWGLAIAVAGILACGQVLVVVTRLASSETVPTGWWWMLALTALVIYSLDTVVLGIGGILLLRDIFKKNSD